MPCLYGKDGSLQRAELDKLTNLLCLACTMIEDIQSGVHHEQWPLQLEAWWEAHKILDEERKKRQQRQDKMNEINQRAEAYRKKLIEEEDV